MNERLIELWGLFRELYDGIDTDRLTPTLKLDVWGGGKIVLEGQTRPELAKYPPWVIAQPHQMSWSAGFDVETNLKLGILLLKNQVELKRALLTEGKR